MSSDESDNGLTIAEIDDEDMYDSEDKEDDLFERRSSNRHPAITKKGERPFRASVFVADNMPPKFGYLRKRATSGGLFTRLNKWQSRYFFAKNHYLAYYKHEDSKKCLASFDLRYVTRIDMISGSDFEIIFDEMGSYQLRALSGDIALEWVNDLRARSKRAVEKMDRLKHLERNEMMKRKDTARAMSVIQSQAILNSSGVIEQETTIDFKLGRFNMWELVSGNIPINELSPSPAKDTIRLTLLAEESVKSMHHSALSISVLHKRDAMNELLNEEDDYNPDEGKPTRSTSHPNSLTQNSLEIVHHDADDIGSSDEDGLSSDDDNIESVNYEEKVPDGLTKEMWKVIVQSAQKMGCNIESDEGAYIAAVNASAALRKRSSTHSQDMRLVKANEVEALRLDEADESDEEKPPFPTVPPLDSLHEARIAAVDAAKSSRIALANCENIKLKKKLNILEMAMESNLLEEFTLLYEAHATQYNQIREDIEAVKLNNHHYLSECATLSRICDSDKELCRFLEPMLGVMSTQKEVIKDDMLVLEPVSTLMRRKLKEVQLEWKTTKKLKNEEIKTIISYWRDEKEQWEVERECLLKQLKLAFLQLKDATKNVTNFGSSKKKDEDSIIIEEGESEEYQLLKNYNRLKQKQAIAKIKEDKLYQERKKLEKQLSSKQTVIKFLKEQIQNKTRMSSSSLPTEIVEE